jgi:hypothetical protein
MKGQYQRERLERVLKIRKLFTYCPECGETVSVDESTFQAIEQTLTKR